MMILFIGLYVKAQENVYFLNKPMAVGCYNATGLMDMTKKATISIKDNVANISMTCVECTKKFEANYIGVFENKGNAYYSTKEERGFITEDNSTIYFFVKKGETYVISGAGNIDKKRAKSLDTEMGTKTYSSSLDDFETLLEKGQAEAEEAAKLAKILKAPTKKYSDEFGIGGQYYFSEISEISLSGVGERFVNTVQFEFCPDENYTIKAHYSDEKFDRFYIADPVLIKALESGQKPKLTYFKGDNLNKIDAFDSQNIRFVEDGVWVVEKYGYFNNKLDCSSFKYNPGKDKNGNPYKKFLLLGKNKKRIEELTNQYDEVLELIGENVLAECNQSRALTAAGKPMPTPGLKDAKLKAETNKVVTAFASKHWKETVLYTYILSKEWSTIRNNNTGLILGRTIRVIVVMKTTSGACQWEEVSIRQDYNGSSYGNSYFGGNTQIIVPVDCKEAKKYM